MALYQNPFTIPVKCYCGNPILLCVSFGTKSIYNCWCCHTSTSIELEFDTMFFHVVQFTPPNIKSNYRLSLEDIENGVYEMPKATLSYESLGTNPDGSLAEGAYKLKLEGNFKTHIEPIVVFIKATVPSSDRTYDPTTYEWFYHEKYHPLMEQALKGSRFTISYGVTKEAFQELKRIQDEYAKQAGQSFATRQVPVDDDIADFVMLLTKANIQYQADPRKWNRETALSFYKKAIRFYHPDLHPERAAQASELNEVWSRLKETYYK